MAVAENDPVQQLFEQELGPPRLPEDLSISVSGDLASIHAASREKEQLTFKLAKARCIDRQAVPAVGTLLGVNYQPSRQPPPRCYPRRPAAAAQEQQAEAPAAAAARQPAAVPAPQPAHATAWLLLQPTSELGINSSLSIVDAGPTGFGGWSQDGFLDLSKRASLEYNLVYHPATGMSGDADVLCTMPKLPLLPRLTARHRMAAAQNTSGVQHISTLSMPVLGSAQARLQVQESAPSSTASATATTVTFELVGRSKSSSRGLAGGAKLWPSLADAFYAGDSSAGSSSSLGGSGSSSDSDDEGSSKAGSSSEQRRRRTTPGLRVQLVPATTRSWEDVNGHWRQSWGSRLSSVVSYQGQQRRWNLDLTQKLGSFLTASGSLVCTAPPLNALRAVAPSAGVNGLTAAAGSSGEDGEIVVAAARLPAWQAALTDGGSTAARAVSTYVRELRVCKAGLKLACRLHRQSRQQLHVESSYDADSGLAHALKYRLGSRGSNDWQQQRGWCNLGLHAWPARQELQLRFDFFAPC